MPVGAVYDASATSASSNSPLHSSLSTFTRLLSVSFSNCSRSVFISASLCVSSAMSAPLFVDEIQPDIAARMPRAIVRARGATSATSAFS